MVNRTVGASGGTAAVAHDAGAVPRPWSFFNATFFSSVALGYTVQASNSADFSNALIVSSRKTVAGAATNITLCITFRYYRAYVTNPSTSATAPNTFGHTDFSAGRKAGWRPSRRSRTHDIRTCALCHSILRAR